MNRIAPALVAALLLAPAMAPAQSLGDVAAKEKEKKDKDKSKKPAKSYTEEDLRGKLGGTMSNPGASATVPGSETTSSGTSADGTPASPAPDAETAAADAAQQEAKQNEWRARKGRIEQEIVRINASINSFQARLADNTVPMYGPGREALVQNLERAKADLTRATADLEAANAEGRTNGYR
ncbi:MAG TPA: hypothetical protein VFQ51_14710 [Vicinamibacteria bacterium]|nr:hypothetical protein [Vicinamibacteria bacterium]